MDMVFNVQLLLELFSFYNYPPLKISGDTTIIINNKILTKWSFLTIFSIFDQNITSTKKTISSDKTYKGTSEHEIKSYAWGESGQIMVNVFFDLDRPVDFSKFG